VGPEELLHHGLKFDIQGRNWPQLVHKLYQEPNSTIKIVSLGGSVTVGYKGGGNTSYPEEFVAWLQQLYPAATFQLTNLARSATAATFAALCVVQHVPEDADLVIVEYSLNAYDGQCQCFLSSHVAGYETLLRKLITKAPNAALMAFAAFMWRTSKYQPTPYYESGEDQHAVVARRYGIPFMSARDALYDAMWDPGNPHGVNMSQILVDNVHPGDYGSKVYASFLAWGLRHQATRILQLGTPTSHEHHRHNQSEQLLPPARRRYLQVRSTGYGPLPNQQGSLLPPPINPEAAQERYRTFCAVELKLKEHVVENKGWKWVDEGTNACPGCHKYGYAATDVGASITFRVDSAVLTDEDRKSKLTVQLAISYLLSYQDMGVARLECISGCKCPAKDLDAWSAKQTSEVTTQRLTISDHPSCLLRLTVLDKTKSSKHKFRVASLAVHKQDKIMSSMYVPGWAFG
jgi:hypothetical protein